MNPNQKNTDEIVLARNWKQLTTKLPVYSLPQDSDYIWDGKEKIELCEF